MDILANETGTFNESLLQEYTENFNESTSIFDSSLEDFAETSTLQDISYIFNGPLTVFIVFIGVFFNIVTLYNLNLNLILKKRTRIQRVREMMQLSGAGVIETQRLTNGSLRSSESPVPTSPAKNVPFRYPK